MFYKLIIIMKRTIRTQNEHNDKFTKGTFTPQTEMTPIVSGVVRSVRVNVSSNRPFPQVPKLIELVNFRNAKLNFSCK